MIISVVAEQAFDKTDHSFTIKTLWNMGIEGIHLNIIMVWLLTWFTFLSGLDLSYLKG